MPTTSLESNKTTSESLCPVCESKSVSLLHNYPGRSNLFNKRWVVRCSGCLLIFTYPLPSKDELTDYYKSGTYWGDFQYKTPYHIPTYHHQAKARVDYIMKHIEKKNSFKVLDVGAGFGVMEDYLKKEDVSNLELWAIEPDPKAKVYLSKMGVRAVNSLDDLRGETFDLIILSHVLEHFNAPVEYLKNLKSRLKKDGSLFIEIPHEDYQFKLYLEPHILFFNRDTLRGALATSGFEVRSIDSCGSLRSKQKNLVKKMEGKNKLMSLIPFQSTLKKIKNSLKNGAKIPKDPLSYPDPFECQVYGEDRIWIRCIANSKS